MSAAEAVLPDLLAPTLVRVAKVTRETHDTFTLTTQAMPGSELPVFSPGQFSMLYNFGVGEIPISISGDPEQFDRIVYTIRSVGKVSHAVISHKAGDSIAMRGPLGTSVGP